MVVIAAWSELQVVLYVIPDLPHFEMRVVLDDLDLLFISDVQVVLLVTRPQHYAEDDGSQIEVFHLVFYSFSQVSLGPRILVNFYL